MATKAVITPNGIEEVELSSEEEAQRQIDIQTGIEEAKLDYIKNRKMEYPDWGDQLNKIYEDGIDKWKSEMVDPVKTKWPKDNSGPVE